MRNKLVKILLVLIIAIFSIQLKVQAAVITSTDKQVESNSGSVTISVTSKQALGSFTLKLTDTAGLTLENTTKGSSAFEISSDKKTITGSSSDGITSLGSFTFKVPTVTSDTTYRIKFSISGMETTDLESIADENNTAVLTVKAPVVEKPEKPTVPPATETPEPETPVVETPKKSSEARLKNFGINPYDFKGFKKDTTEYTVEVPNSVTEVEVYAEPVDGNAKIEGDGKVTLNEGNNKIGVTVTAEDGTTKKTYKLTIKRITAAEEAAENGEARLKSFGIKPEEYDFSGFDSDKTEYSVEVPNEVEEIEVYATAMNSEAQITGTGMITLEEGLNELKIDVIAVDGTKKTYTLNVTRKESEEEQETTEELGLTTLSIVGLKLSPSFKVGTYQYTATLEEDISSLEIKAKANIEDATVEIVGNENLQQGENVITILVKNEETEESATYQIIVEKYVIKEVVVQTSWFKPSTWGKEEKIKIAIIVVLIILIISAIILKIKIGKENPKGKKRELPGAVELDKAIAEHQELSEEPSYTTEKVEQSRSEMTYKKEMAKNEVEQNYIQDIAKNKFGMEEDFEEKPRRRGRHF